MIPRSSKKKDVTRNEERSHVFRSGAAVPRGSLTDLFETVDVFSSIYFHRCGLVF